MDRYVITCCSTADLSEAHFKRLRIPVVFFHFELDGVSYPDDMGKTISPKELFSRMEAGAETKTSQVSVGEYLAFFRPFLAAGQDVLHVTLSSGLSGTYAAACVARATLKEEFPDRTLYIVDSLGASSGYGLIMDTLAAKRDEGMEIHSLYTWIEEHKLNLHHWFYSTDLTFYIRGGRISKTAGFFGKALNICPLLNMDAAGHLIPREKVRGKRHVLERTVELMEQHAEGGLDYSGKCFLCHSLCGEDAAELAALIEARFKKLNGRVLIYPIGATIGSHTGPGTVSIFFWGDKRT
ncbi:MAG: DegV family protein [Clostridia bacterium]|nr:DegV family protein [Clostridia bacterium]